MGEIIEMMGIDKHSPNRTPVVQEIIAKVNNR